MAVNTVGPRLAAAPSRRRAGSSGAVVRPRSALILAALLAAAGCDDSQEAQAKRAIPFDLPAEQCLGQLRQREMTFEPIQPVSGENGCGIETAVTLSAGQATLSRPATLGCPLAVRISDFERDILQPLAVRYFGQPVARIHHYGAYACRARSDGGGRLSEHARGRAIDVAAFELADGTLIRVGRDWHGIGRRSRFLHNVAREACALFHVVLSPGHDRAHRDHLHFDTGPWRLCGV